jgi:hypothetical protein
MLNQAQQDLLRLRRQSNYLITPGNTSINKRHAFGAKMSSLPYAPI